MRFMCKNSVFVVLGTNSGRVVLPSLTLENRDAVGSGASEFAERFTAARTVCTSAFVVCAVAKSGSFSRGVVLLFHCFDNVTRGHRSLGDRRNPDEAQIISSSKRMSSAFGFISGTSGPQSAGANWSPTGCREFCLREVVRERCRGRL